jgi:hypothetical protein
MGRNGKKQYSGNSKQKPHRRDTQGKKEENTILASASYSHTPQINVLEEDLHGEYEKDKGRTDRGALVLDKWVRFFDPHSSFLKRMVALLANSPTLRNITNQKTALTLGSGLSPVTSDFVPFLQTIRKLLKLETRSEKALKEINTLIGSVNLNNETLEEVLQKLVFDYYAFGNAIAELKETTRDGKPVVFLYHIPLGQVGIKEANNNNIIEAIGVTANWDIDGNDPNAIKEIPMYPNFSTDGSSAIHIKNYAPGHRYWGLPNWIAAQFWAETEYKIPKYNNSKLDNGFKPSANIQVFGNFTEPEADTIADNLIKSYTGTGENGQVSVQVIRKKEDAAEITLFEDKSEGSYIELQRLSSQGLITAYGWTPCLAGIAIAGKLGGSSEKRDDIEFVTNMETKPVQRKFEQAIINPFIKENQAVNNSLNGIMLQLANMNPISVASKLVPNEVLTKNEMREIYGYPEIEEEELEGKTEAKTDTKQEPETE